MDVIRKVIYKLSGHDKNKIDQFIKVNDGLVFHETKFNEIVSEVFNSRLSYFLAFKGIDLIGICPVHSFRTGLLTRSYSNPSQYEIPYGGWVYSTNSAEIKDLWERMPLNLNESLNYWASFLGFTNVGITDKAKIFQTGLIDLTNSEEAIFTSEIHSKRRNMIRKAVKAGVIIRMHGTEGLPHYFSLMQAMHNKQGLASLSNEYYQRIFDAYLSIGNVLLMIAYFKNKPLSGVIIIGNNNVMHYWQGASAIDVPNLGQGEFLQWEAIKWAKRQGSKLYDLCVIEKERLPNIAKFKMGFCSSLTPFYCTIKKSFVYRILNKFQNVFIS